MRRFFVISVLLLPAATCALLLSSSCTRRPLDVPTNAIRVEMHNDYRLPYRQLGIYHPYNYKVLFYDPSTKALVGEDFCGEKGGPVTAEPGMYAVYAYNLDLVSTLVSGRDSLHTLRAYTEPARVEMSSLFISCKSAFRAQTKSEGITLESTKGFPGFENDNVINEPDPLFGGYNASASVPYLAVSDADCIVPVSTSTKLCQSTIEIRGISHTEYISSIQVFVTNLASQRDIYLDKPAGEPATVGFLVTDISEDVITGVFNHFGILGEEDDAPINTAYIVINDNWGNRYLFVEDVTEDIDTTEEDDVDPGGEPRPETDPIRGKHSQVNVELTFEIPEGHGDGTGGFSPDIDDWAVVKHSVKIG